MAVQQTASSHNKLRFKFPINALNNLFLTSNCELTILNEFLEGSPKTKDPAFST